ncbi:MAG: hypothetical protein NW220_15465 [Leptolyngbyaceae cyanobacterium bins.349]|nr:hypothetical protein [Leptolyngbyaceae cyanobacterium bins.349]
MTGLLVGMKKTVIKTAPVEDSKKLPANSKFDFLRGQTLEVRWAEFDRATNHVRFELVSGRNGVTVWYGYAPDVRFVPDNRRFAMFYQGSEADETLAEV